VGNAHVLGKRYCPPLVREFPGDVFGCEHAIWKSETEIELKTPFVEWSKTEIAERGLELDVPYEMTWSCYRNEGPACGTN
jgi:hypothetical protein